MNRQAGRLGAVALGVLMVAYGAATAFHMSEAIPVTMITTGAVLAGAGLLGPYVRRIKAPGLELETRNERQVDMAAEVEQLRSSPPPDPDTVDLVGDDSWDGARYRLGERAVECLLTRLGGSLYGCQARIFLYDAVLQKLMPAFRPEDAVGEPVGWPPGVGVTGAAYEEQTYKYATGDRTHDGTFGLSKDLQERFSDLTAVAAFPLADRSGTVFGTLSLSSRSPATNLTEPVGYVEHVALAQQVSVALVDLVGLTPGSGSVSGEEP